MATTDGVAQYAASVAWSKSNQQSPNFVAIGPSQFAYAPPTGEPLDTLHSLYSNTPITAQIPPVSSAEPPPPPFNPATVGALMTWFDASAVGFNPGANTWTNLGTNGGTATLSGVTSTTINGKTAAVFTSSARGTFSWKFTTNSRGFFGVWKTDVNITTSAQGSYILAEQNNSFYFTLCNIFNGTGNAALATISFNQQLEIGANQNPPKTTTLTAYGLSQDGAGPSSLNNYVTFQGVPQTLFWNNTTTGFVDIGNFVTCYINGGAPAPTSTIGMTLCEILVYDAALTPATATTVTNYLKTKWGIA